MSSGPLAETRVDPRAPPRWRRLLPAAEWTVLALLVGLFVAHGLVPAWKRLNTDFPNYYLAARLLRGGYPLERMYDWVWFQRQKDHAGVDWGIVSYGPITPFSAFVLAPFASCSALTAKRVWLVVTLALLGASALVLRRLTRLSLRRVAVIMFLSVVPLRTSFEFGQQYVLVLFLIALAALLYARGRDGSSGAVLALATVLKLYPALFVLLFLVKRRWTALASFGVATVVAIGAGVASFGLEPLRVYVTRVLPRISQGEVHDPYVLAASSPTVLLRRFFVAEPQLNPRPIVPAPLAYALLQPTVQAILLVSALWVVARRRRDLASDTLMWGALAALSLLLSAGAATYHFCILIFATVVAVDALLRAHRVTTAGTLVGLHALVCAPWNRLVPPSLTSSSIAWVLLGMPRLYALLAYWAVYLAAIVLLSPAERARRGEAALFAVGFAALSLVGIIRAKRHLDGVAETYAGRLPEDAQTLIATAPTVTAGAVYFSRLADEGYALGRVGEPAGRPPVRGEDFFQPTVAIESDEAWVEVSSARSRIVRFGADTFGAAAKDLPTEVDDAQGPRVSPDGRWLGFLRETAGRTRLFVLDRGPAGERVPHPEPPVGVGPDDVLDFALFPDGRLVLSAAEGHDTPLFVVAATPSRTMAPLGVSGRYPAVSPDGQRLAYSREVRGAWQLEVMDLRTHARNALTHADCNSTSPSWSPDGASLVYASDCGRGVGATALCQITVVP
jgi:hypothetical protein